MQLTIVFVHFDYSFCQFCAWIFLFFLHPIYTQSLWLLLQNSAYLYKQIMNRIHMDLYELKWPFLMKEGGIHCKIELKNDLVDFPAFELNWVALLDQWMLKSWLNQKFGFISYLLYTAILQSCPSKSTLQISASTFEQINRQLLLYRTICRTLYSIWPRFGYFSELLVKGFSKNFIFEDFHNFFPRELSRAVVHGIY